MTATIPGTPVRRHRVRPSSGPTQDAVFLGAVRLARAGATACGEAGVQAGCDEDWSTACTDGGCVLQ